MALILNIETSSPVCSVCLAKDGAVVDFRESREANSHARLLTVMLEELASYNKISLQQLDAVAVSAGPGSYTGLRIGVSAVKGLCYALNKPLVSVPTLFSLAEGIEQKIKSATAFYMPAMDARRMDIYTAVYDSEGNEVLKTACLTVNEELKKNIASFGNVYVGGNAASKCKNIFTASNIHFVEEVDCDSRWMVNIAEEKYLRKDFENIAYFEPVYLKEFTGKAGN